MYHTDLIVDVNHPRDHHDYHIHRHLDQRNRTVQQILWAIYHYEKGMNRKQIVVRDPLSRDRNINEIMLFSALTMLTQTIVRISTTETLIFFILQYSQVRMSIVFVIVSLVAMLCQLLDDFFFSKRLLLQNRISR